MIWNWRLGLGIRIGDWEFGIEDWGMGLGNGTGDRDCNLKLGIGIVDFGKGLRFVIGIGDEGLVIIIWHLGIGD